MTDKKLVILENGVITEQDFDQATERAIFKQNAHKCSECTRVTSRKCPKVSDTEKKAIDKYPFIVRGYQVIAKGTEVKKFGVFDCKLYERSVHELAEILEQRIRERTNAEAYSSLVTKDCQCTRERVAHNLSRVKGRFVR